MADQIDLEEDNTPLETEEGEVSWWANSSIETDTTGYTAYEGVTLSRVTTEAFVGAASLKAVATGVLGYGTQFDVDPPGGLVAGDIWTLSFWVKAEGAAIGKSMYAILRRGFDTNEDTAVPFTLTSGWQKITSRGTVVNPLNTTVRSYIINDAPAVSGDTFYADLVQVEQGVVYLDVEESVDSEDYGFFPELSELAAF